MWALRFVSGEAPVLYRLLVLSRNLTFDRSWDTVLALEGELRDRRNAYAINHPLGDFFEVLPDLAVHDLPDTAGASVDLVQHELRRVWFEPPEGFDSLAFWPLGLSRSRQWPFHGVRRMLVVSPFVKGSLLERLPGTDGGVLVSRPEALSELEPATIKRFGQTFVLRQEAESEDELTKEERNGEDGQRSGEDSSEGGERGTLTGLHAKLFVADDGWDARIWTGSANATNAAFSGNVEFLVELEGRKSFCGIDKVLSRPGDATGFADLLQEYEPTPERLAPDPTRERLEARADAVHRSLATSRLTGRVSPAPDDAGRYDVRLIAAAPAPPPPQGVSTRCWPVTLSSNDALAADVAGPEAALFSLSLEALTTFFAFEVTASAEGESLSRRFVLSVPLEGAPEGRHESIVRSLLSDRERVMRLILLLLAEGDADEQRTSLTVGRLLGGSGNGAGVLPGIPLFEEFVRALWSNPKALDRIEAMLATLRKTDETARLIPEELDEIWEPLMEARRRART